MFTYNYAKTMVKDIQSEVAKNHLIKMANHVEKDQKQRNLQKTNLRLGFSRVGKYGNNPIL
ncbi:MAG: hypothetical protein JEZ06_16770 [Anaerolineaceae bacterium]|nr:hypothetical protein [Anaerolineaceae bacterium]